MEEPAAPPPDDPPAYTGNVEVFLSYLRKAVALTLGSLSPGGVLAPTVFTDKPSQDAVKKFLSDPQSRVVLAQKFHRKEDDHEGADGSTGSGSQEFVYVASTEIAFRSRNVSSVGILKRVPVIDTYKEISSQVMIFDLKDGSPHELFHSVIAGIMSPFFKSFIRTENAAGKENDKIVVNAERKLAELGTIFLHLQQNTGVPEVVLTPNPVVASVIKKCVDGGKKASVSDFDPVLLEDSAFLNTLEQGVTKWIRDIQKVTKLDRDASSGSTLQEISFWMSMETALQRIEEKCTSLEVTLTLEFLKQGRRFHALVSFTELRSTMDTVSDYCILMKDFPIQDLLTATSLEKIRDAVRLIVNHMHKIRQTKYPIARFQMLVDALSRNVTAQILKVLGTRYLMHHPYPEFEKVLKQCSDIFMTWSGEHEKVMALVRDMMKKKRDGDSKLAWRGVAGSGHKALQSRMESMKKFRWGHQQLLSVITRVLQPRKTPAQEDASKGDATGSHAQSSAIEEVNSAYECVKEVDCLDTSKEGQEAWDMACKRYGDRIDKVESKITERLRYQLGSARNANEMFRIFAQYNALFVRPRIRGAFRDYQTQLIQKVKVDIEYLHDKFKVGYQNSGVSAANRLRDIPPVAGCVMWTKQFERQMTMLMGRVEAILGRGWENHVDGQILKADGDSFRLKLTTSMQETFEAWCQRVQSRPLGVSGRIFLVANQRSRGGTALHLRVNFHPAIISLWKEVRNFKWMLFRVPIGIVNRSHQINQMFPYAVSLIESVRAYERTCNIISTKPPLSLLVSGLKAPVQALIIEGVALVWESHRVEPYVQRFSEATSAFQKKVDDLVLIEKQIDVELRSLDTCLFSANSFADILNKIQKATDDLSLRQYSNLSDWTSKIDEEVEKKLANRLQNGLSAWLTVLRGKEEDLQNTDTDDSPTNFTGSVPKIERIIHEFRITNQVMFLNPPVSQCRTDLMTQLWTWASTILSQKRLQSSRYRQTAPEVDEDHAAGTYQSVLLRLPNGPAVLTDITISIEELMAEVDAYVKDWLRYQALWDLQPETVYSRLENDMEKWIQILSDIKKSRATFDTSDTSKEIGPVVIDFARIQSKVTLKYDLWHKEVLGKYESLLGQSMTDFYTTLTSQRGILEQLSLDSASTSESVSLITSMQNMKRRMNGWEKQMGQLQSKITAEDRVLESKTSDTLTNWNAQKPSDGSLRPEVALSQISIFEQKLQRLKDEREHLSKAKEALEMQPENTVDPMLEQVVVCIEELQDLKGVWSEVARIWKQIDEMKETPWSSVQPRNIRQSLETLLRQLNEMPSRMRQYASYEFIKQLLQSYTKFNVLIVELKSEALKDRHWSELMRQMNVKWNLGDLTLGHVWDTNLQKFERTIRDVMMTAQGELALENFLKQVKETWQLYELDLVGCQDRTHLIRGWDDLFTKVKEHINSLEAMKLSLYYKVFEENA